MIAPLTAFPIFLTAAPILIIITILQDVSVVTIEVYAGDFFEGIHLFLYLLPEYLLLVQACRRYQLLYFFESEIRRAVALLHLVDFGVVNYDIGLQGQLDRHIYQLLNQGFHSLPLTLLLL